MQSCMQSAGHKDVVGSQKFVNLLPMQSGSSLLIRLCTVTVNQSSIYGTPNQSGVHVLTFICNMRACDQTFG